MSAIKNFIYSRVRFATRLEPVLLHSPSQVLTYQLILSQKVKGQGHKVQIHIEVD